MKIDLYQDDKECYFWTKEELGYLIEQYPELFTMYSTSTFITYYGHELRIKRGKFDTFIKGEIDKDVDCFILVWAYGSWPPQTMDSAISVIENNPEKKFIIVAKNVEDYWLIDHTRRSDSLFKQIGNCNNVKVIWDVDGVDYRNFYFEPKVNLQNYYNNGTFPGFMFINGHEIISGLKKPYRIGIHLNKITDKIREHLFKQYRDNTNPNLYFTSTSTKHNKIFSNQLFGTNDSRITNDWYNEQFVELTIKSDIEVIYETFTAISDYRWLLKWNEKTIKQLYLGKPFIHSDPSAHSLFKPNGLTPYRSLYTDELWNMYEEYDNNNLLKMNYTYSPFYWKEALDRNIEWLLNMRTDEWEWRLREANDEAQRNRKIIEGYIFNQSLFNYIDGN